MIPEWFSFIDAAFVLAVLLFIWGGFQKGFAAQLAPILSFLILGVLLFFAYPYVYTFLGRAFRNIDQTVLMWLLLILVTAAAVTVFVMFSKLLSNLLKAQFSENSDHVLGFLLGAVRGILTTLLVMVFLVMLGPSQLEDRFCEKSYTGRFVSKEMVMRIRPRLSRPLVQEKTKEWKDWLIGQEEAGVLE